jgi:hypothetical protein
MTAGQIEQVRALLFILPILVAPVQCHAGMAVSIIQHGCVPCSVLANWCQRERAGSRSTRCGSCRMVNGCWTMFVGLAED